MGISQFFKGFYDEEPAGGPAVGSIWWAPVPESREVPLILDVKRTTPDEHSAVDFEFVEAGSQHFKSRTRLPIKRLSLDDTQDLIVSKGKKTLASPLRQASWRADQPYSSRRLGSFPS